nr:RNA-directed DNA polymerase, eukaryota [Tanacetum cinerariifolium]
VSESSFMHKNDTSYKDVNSCKKGEVGSHSEDPFNIYGILDGQKNNVCNSFSDEPKFPHSFTPYNNDQEKNVEENIKDTTERIQSLSNKLNDRCSNREFSSQRSMNSHSQKSKVCESILDLMDELVIVGQTMGYNMAEQVSTCDYFVALMGTWAPTSSKLLIISVYAPQELNERRDLWDYLRTFIDRREGDTVIMGDFNEVLSEHERFGSTFNRQWAIAFNNFISSACLIDLLLEEVDKLIDQEKSNDEILIKRITLFNDLQKLNNRNAMEISQKAKIRWSIEGDENSIYFHGIMNKKRSQLAIRGTLANWEWISEPHRVKNEIFTHFKKQFSPIQAPSICFDFTFSTRLSSDQVQDLKRIVTYEEVKMAVWDCGTNKSPGPDGFSFEFYRKYWKTIDDDVFQAVRDFFVNGHFPRGCNSSFIALILKIQDAKFVKDFRPISIIGSVYKIIAKFLANRLCVVLPYLISDVQSAFVANRQILDGPFILNELLSLCKFKKLNGMIFNVDFEKAFDYVKWDYLDETLKAFGIGVSLNVVAVADSLIGCFFLTTPFNYLGVKVGNNMRSPFPFKVGSHLDSALSYVYIQGFSWHVKSFGIYSSEFFYGVDGSDRKLAWTGWNIFLTSKKNGGLGVSSFIAHNRALLFKWVWRFLTDGSSLRTRFIKAIFSNKRDLDTHKLIRRRSPWQDVILAIRSLQSKGINLMDFIQLATDAKRWCEAGNYGLLCSKVADLVLPNILDRWCWSLEGSQEFSVKSSRILIDNTRKLKFQLDGLESFPSRVVSRLIRRRCNLRLGNVSI